MQEKEKKPLNGVEKPRKIKKKMSKNKKLLVGIIIGVVAVMLAVTAVLIVSAVKRNTPPELSTVRGRIEELVNASHEVNDLLWGEGLPTYPRVYLRDAETFTVRYGEHEDTAYYYVIPDDAHGEVIAYHFWLRYVPEGTQTYQYVDVENNVPISGEKAAGMDLYRYATRSLSPIEGREPIFHSAESGYYYYRLEGNYTFEDSMYDSESDPESGYDYVNMIACKYFYVEDLKAKAAAVFSADFLPDIYGGLFDGFTTPAGYVSGARYRDFYDPDASETGSVLIKSTQFEPMFTARRHYNFDTMTVLEGSTSTFLRVELDSWLEGDESNVIRTRLNFTLGENGQWYLSSFTF